MKNNEGMQIFLSLSLSEHHMYWNKNIIILSKKYNEQSNGTVQYELRPYAVLDGIQFLQYRQSLLSSLINSENVAQNYIYTAEMREEDTIFLKCNKPLIPPSSYESLGSFDEM